MAADLFRRRWLGDGASCGCRWEQHTGYGDVLVECRPHHAKTMASVAHAELDRELAMATRRRN